MPGLAFDDGSPVTNEHLKIYELQQERERKTLAERATKEPAASSLPRSKSDITYGSQRANKRMWRGVG